jgi:hypothetical protein
MFADRSAMIATPLLPGGGTIPALTPQEAEVLADLLRQPHQIDRLLAEIEATLAVTLVDGDVLERAYYFGRDISDALTAAGLASKAEGVRLKGVSRLAAICFEAGLHDRDFLALVDILRTAFEGRLASEPVDYVIGADGGRDRVARPLSA